MAWKHCKHWFFRPERAGTRLKAARVDSLMRPYLVVVIPPASDLFVNTAWYWALPRSLAYAGAQRRVGCELATGRDGSRPVASASTVLAPLAGEKRGGGEGRHKCRPQIASRRVRRLADEVFGEEELAAQVDHAETHARIGRADD